MDGAAVTATPTSYKQFSSDFSNDMGKALEIDAKYVAVVGVEPVTTNGGVRFASSSTQKSKSARVTFEIKGGSGKPLDALTKTLKAQLADKTSPLMTGKVTQNTNAAAGLAEVSVDAPGAGGVRPDTSGGSGRMFVLTFDMDFAALADPAAYQQFTYDFSHNVAKSLLIPAKCVSVEDLQPETKHVEFKVQAGCGKPLDEIARELKDQMVSKMSPLMTGTVTKHIDTKTRLVTSRMFQMTLDMDLAAIVANPDKYTQFLFDFGEDVGKALGVDAQCVSVAELTPGSKAADGQRFAVATLQERGEGDSQQKADAAEKSAKTANDAKGAAIKAESAAKALVVAAEKKANEPDATDGEKEAFTQAKEAVIAAAAKTKAATLVARGKTADAAKADETAKAAGAGAKKAAAASVASGATVEFQLKDGYGRPIDALVNDLKVQLADKNSALMSGKVTRHAIPWAGISQVGMNHPSPHDAAVAKSRVIKHPPIPPLQQIINDHTGSTVFHFEVPHSVNKDHAHLVNDDCLKKRLMAVVQASKEGKSVETVPTEGCGGMEGDKEAKVEEDEEAHKFKLAQLAVQDSTDNISFLKALLVKRGIGGFAGKHLDKGDIQKIAEGTVGDMLGSGSSSAAEGALGGPLLSPEEEKKAAKKRRKEKDATTKLQMEAQVKAANDKLMQTESALRAAKAQQSIDKKANKKLKGEKDMLAELSKAAAEKSREKDARMADMVDAPAG
jgi:hypothetical protein